MQRAWSTASAGNLESKMTIVAFHKARSPTQWELTRVQFAPPTHLFRGDNFRTQARRDNTDFTSL